MIRKSTTTCHIGLRHDIPCAIIYYLARSGMLKSSFTLSSTIGDLYIPLKSLLSKSSDTGSHIMKASTEKCFAVIGIGLLQSKHVFFVNEHSLLFLAL